MKNRFLASLLPALCLLAACIGTAHADATLDKIKQRGKVVVGVMLSGPPFGTIDPATQKPIGYNVELAEGVARASAWAWRRCRCSRPTACSSCSRARSTS
jgi:polar amino acid transport system substrate-binding protein